MSRSHLLPVMLAGALFSSLPRADALPTCDDWMEDRLTSPDEDGFPSIDVGQLKSAGMSIEPSRRMRAAGYEWEHHIQIALPPSYGDAKRHFPVLWVTDGQFFFELAAGLVASCANQHMPEMIIVGIGSPPEASEHTQRRRSFDFSPTTGVGYTGFGAALHDEYLESVRKRVRAQGKAPYPRGGAPRFLRFLVEDVRGQLLQDYRMTDDHTLFGDSGGGVFCTYALLSRPAAFDRYICGSGSLASGDFEVFRMEERYAQSHKDLQAAVFFAAGEAEVLQGESISSWGILSSTARMAEILKMRAYPSLQLHFRVFPGENHLSVIPLTFAWGLRTLWEGRSEVGDEHGEQDTGQHQRAPNRHSRSGTP